MLDLAFLIVAVIALYKASKGTFNDLLCNIACVIGVIASVLGMIQAFFSSGVNSYSLGLMNILVFAISFLVKPAAKHVVKLYTDKIEEMQRAIELEIKRGQELNSRSAYTKDASYIDQSSAPNAPNTMPNLATNQPTDLQKQEAVNLVDSMLQKHSGISPKNKPTIPQNIQAFNNQHSFQPIMNNQSNETVQNTQDVVKGTLPSANSQYIDLDARKQQAINMVDDMLRRKRK